ncbi:double-strand break repair helicase AddA [Sphingomonas aestuarii]
MAVSDPQKSAKPLPTLLGNQAAASDPRLHVWLAASAGTGKTQVLSARVYRLLLRGVDPGAILCLTFTKAGAAEMADRINDRLARWVRMGEPDLKLDLIALGEEPDAKRIARARRLFAQVLDAPGGGIRIQTIHGFCQTLLSAFPIEAGLVPGFRPLEAREESVMAREALAELLTDEAAIGRSTHADAIGALSLRLGEGAAEAFLLACARAPDAMAGLPSGIQPFLRRALDLPSGDVEAALEAACSDDAFDVASLRRIIDANRAWGTATGSDHAEIGDYWLEAAPAERARLIDDLRSIAHTAKGEPRKYSAKLSAADADYVELAVELGEACAKLASIRARAAFADLLASSLDAGRAYADAYGRAKRRSGAVDFGDLIRETVNLLRQPGIGEWVRFKLDQVTDHVLIDEAQDTNWDQWTIISAMAEEYFAGEGTGGARHRTLFTVGDYKQAIFGFQGTDPFFYALAHRKYETLDAGLAGADADPARLSTLSLTHSFRSTRPILEFVDAAIAAMPEGGMGSHSDAEPHASEVKGPGRVTLWSPTLAVSEDAEEEGWIDDAVRAHAKRIARHIAGLIRSGATLGAKGRALTPGDIMVLVKRRGELASLIVARLYAEGVPVAGVDRLRLNAPLAVQDLLAAIRFALQPEDDLSLASLLVSPLIGWSQDQLMRAAPRERGSLWRHLRNTQPTETLRPLLDILARADFETPYRFLEAMLSGNLDGRRKLVARLGEEARDPIEELLSAALNFEQIATPSLQRFLDWFDRGDVEIKRDPSQGADAVRVMTAHGAKGLQAPLVMLADAAADPDNVERAHLAWQPKDHDGPAFPIFRPRGAEKSDALEGLVADAERREMEEHWRLFYVAATRAEEELIVTGALTPGTGGEVPERSWYAVSAAAFDALGIADGDEDGERRFEGFAPQPPVAMRGQATATPSDPTPLPVWLRAPAPQEARPPRPLAPSSIGADDAADPPPGPALRAAAERGLILHRLFERLPAVAPADRRAAALRWLERACGIDDESEREGLANNALGVIDDPRFADLFGPDALAEAPIAAVVDGAVVAGTVDRLLVTETRIRVVDFKTSRHAPAGIEAVPDAHVRQMAAYVAALSVVFSGRAIDAALVYTAGPVAIEVPAELITRYKPGYGAAEQSFVDGA